MIVLSLFDGDTGGQIAFERSKIKINKYYASEIDKDAIRIAQKNYPDTIQLGDIRDWKNWNIEKPDIIIGGSPCTGFSFAGKQLNFNDPQSKLFFQFVEILRHYKPKYFLFENVKMKIEYERVITQYLNCYPVEINSALVSAQNRRRLYWSNIGSKGTDLFGTIISNIKQPKDKGIVLKDILQPENEIDEKYYITNPKWLAEIKKGLKKRRTQINEEKAICLLTSNYNVWRGNYIQLDISGKGYKSQQDRIYFLDNKMGAIPACRVENKLNIVNNKSFRHLTPIESERLQTIPDNFTEGVSDNKRYRMLGNGWTIDVIAHILKRIKEEG